MKVTDALKNNPATLSFEFFPPKTPEQGKRLFEVIAVLKKFNPDFVSVTYGAMGTTRGKTFFWVEEIKKEYGIEPVAHLTCVAATRPDIKAQIEQLEKLGVENILALRGDPPKGEKDFTPPAEGFHFARELIAFIKKEKPFFCLGAAGFPEKHRDSPDVDTDTKYLKEKVEAGAEYIITQLFFENRHFFDFRQRCAKAEITVPILPGIMPIASFKQITRITDMCGATIPGGLFEKLKKHQDDAKAIQEISIEQTVNQCRELLKAGVPGLHFFVLNQAEPVSTILSELRR